MRYFKKYFPATVVDLGNGTHVQFDTIDQNIGYYRTESAFILGMFDQFIAQQRYGLQEIKQAEFEADFIQKKSGKLSRPAWREELSVTALRSLKSPASPVAQLDVAADEPQRSPPPQPVRPAREAVTMAESAPSVVQTQPPPVPATPPPPAAFTPPVGRRQRGKKG